MENSVTASADQQPVFTNHFRSVPEESERLDSFLFWHRPVNWILLVIFLIPGIANTLDALIIGEWDFRQLEWFIYPLILVAIQCISFIRYKNLCRRRRAEVRQASGEPNAPVDVTTLFYEAHFTQKTPYASLDILYSSVKKVLLAEDRLLLLTKANTVYSIKLGCTTPGTDRDLFYFLIGKQLVFSRKAIKKLS